MPDDEHTRDADQGPDPVSNPEPDSALVSHIPLQPANTELHLATGELRLRNDTHSILLDGSVVLATTPNLRIAFQGRSEGVNAATTGALGLGWTPDRLEVVGDTLTGDISIVKSRNLKMMTTPETLSMSGDLGSFGDGGGELQRVGFLVPNFRKYLGAPIRHADSGLSLTRLPLSGSGWTVVLDGRNDLDEVLQQLGTQGGYAVTHAASLARADEGAFTSDEAFEVLEGLSWFLSFVCGRWTGPLLATGYTAADAIGWRDWRVGRVGRWSTPFSWCDRTHWRTAQEGFDGFMQLWSKPAYNGVLRTAIGQYVSANTPDPLEVAIMTAQSGLELLGWLAFVETGSIGRQEWRAARASWKISRLIAAASVAPDIPDICSHLRGLNPEWEDGPAAVAGVRNRLVHPRIKGGEVGWPADVLVDAWRLSSWYLELALLHLLGIRGPIQSRLNPAPATGTVELPPWNTDPA